MSTETKKKQPWIARCQGGPFDGRDAVLGTEPKGKLIRVWGSILVEGQLMHDENIDELHDGDALYEEIQRSQLDEEILPDVIVRGGIYRYVGWKCPMCDEDGFNEKTLGPHIRERHPLSDQTLKELDDAEVAGPLEGKAKDGQEIEALVKEAFEKHTNDA